MTITHVVETVQKLPDHITVDNIELDDKKWSVEVDNRYTNRRIDVNLNNLSDKIKDAMMFRIEDGVVTLSRRCGEEVDPDDNSGSIEHLCIVVDENLARPFKKDTTLWTTDFPSPQYNGLDFYKIPVAVKK